MIKYIILAALLGLAFSAPAAIPEDDPAPKPPVPSELKTPASTSKLSRSALLPQFIAPISRIAYAAPVLSQISPYAYTYTAPLAPVEINAIPTSYSIEQHGYHITY